MKVNLLRSLSDNRLNSIISTLEDLFKSGQCCPRMCNAPEIRPCGAPEEGIKVASFAVHDGEEPPVSGWNGAGNIFFSGCGTKCVFCQNWPISHGNNGKVYSSNEFGEKIKKLLNRKVHNINLVTGDHFFGKVLKSLAQIKDSINVPLIYNCSGCHSEKLFEAVLKTMDILLFDVKYCDNALSSGYSEINDYTGPNGKCLEMLLDADIPWVENDVGLLQRGVIIRHLVIPGQTENSLKVVELLNEYKDRGLEFKLSLMSQYFPAYKALEMEELNKKVDPEDYEKIIKKVEEYEIEGWIQPL
jgi:putative pyruvate formate lyase activating enzyme